MRFLLHHSAEAGGSSKPNLPESNLVGVKDTSCMDITYEYDEFGRVIIATCGLGTMTVTTYDV